MAWDSSGRIPSVSSWPAACRSDRMMSARLASMCRPAAVAGPVIASRSSGPVIGPTTNEPSCIRRASPAWPRTGPSSRRGRRRPPAPAGSPRGAAGRAAAAHKAAMNACWPASAPPGAGEDLLELIHHQDQAPGLAAAGRWPGSPRQADLGDGQLGLAGVGGQCLPDGLGVTAAQRGKPGGQFGERVAARRHDHAGPVPRPLQLTARGQRGQQARVQQRGLPRPGRAGDDDHGRAGQPPGQLDDQLGGQPLAAVEHLGVCLVER